MKPPFAPAFIRGVRHFNAREFWEAHEAWEELWLESESRLVEFLQGLIQLAAAYHHVRRGTLRGAVRLFDSSLRKLALYPRNYCEIDRDAAVEAAARHRIWAERRLACGTPETLPHSEYPVIDILTIDEVFTTPESPW